MTQDANTATAAKVAKATTSTKAGGNKPAKPPEPAQAPVASPPVAVAALTDTQDTPSPTPLQTDAQDAQPTSAAANADSLKQSQQDDAGDGLVRVRCRPGLEQFYRAGLRFDDEPRVLAIRELGAQRLAQLQAEPNLVLEYVLELEPQPQSQQPQAAP